MSEQTTQQRDPQVETNDPFCINQVRDILKEKGEYFVMAYKLDDDGKDFHVGHSSKCTTESFRKMLKGICVEVPLIKSVVISLAAELFFSLIDTNKPKETGTNEQE